MKSCPLGLRAIAASMATCRSSSLSDARKGVRKSAASSWPRHMNSVPVQVTRTRLHEFAEIMRERCDEADASAGLLRAHIARRATGRVSDRLEREAFAEALRAPASAGLLIDALAVDFAEWHHFDEGDVHTAPMRPLRQRVNSSSFTSFSATALILIASPASCAASMPSSTLREIAAARDGAEFSGIERVDGDIDAGTPQSARPFGVFCELAPLVVSVSSSSARGRVTRQRPEQHHDISRISGSPPVMRSFCTPLR